MVSHDELSFDKASPGQTGSFTWTVFLCTCILAAATFLVAKYVLVKVEPAVPFSVAIPPQLANDHQWEVKGKKVKPGDPEVLSQQAQSNSSRAINIHDRSLARVSTLDVQQMVEAWGLPSTRQTLPTLMPP